MKTMMCLALAICACVAAASGTRMLAAQKPAEPPPLRVAGATNTTPSLAVLGRTVAAVWTVTKDGAADVYLAMSEDGGATFSAPRRVNDQNGDATANNEQPPRVVMSRSGSARTVTVFWSKRNEGPAFAPAASIASAGTPQRARKDAVRMARSTDGGRTFPAARLAHDPEFSGARGWESLAVAPDGAVHAVWLDGRDAERKMAAAAHSGMAHKGQPPQDIYHAVVGRDGRITDSLIATGVCFCCKTAVVVDARGTVYAAWRHIFPGSMRDIAFARSTDGGRRFDPLVRVSEDKWELNGCPEDGPTLAVDQSGVIHIAWATVIQDGDGPKAIFYATSRDGKTFSPRARLPVTDGATPAHPQLTLTAEGGAAIVWDELMNGLRRISFTRVSRTGAIGRPRLLSGDESASHPVIVPVDRDLLVAWTSRSSTAKSAAEPSVIRTRRIKIP